MSTFLFVVCLKDVNNENECEKQIWKLFKGIDDNIRLIVLDELLAIFFDRIGTACPKIVSSTFI